MVKIFDAVIGKKNEAWYGDNMLDLTLKGLVVVDAGDCKYACVETQHIASLRENNTKQNRFYQTIIFFFLCALMCLM